MGIKQGLKRALIRRVLKKRKGDGVFDELSSERFELPTDAGTDFNNSYYFCAHNTDGTSLLFRLGKRGGGTHEVWFAYYDRAGNAFVNLTQLYAAQESPAAVKCIAPLKEWEFAFKGKLVRVSPDDDLIARPYGAELDAVFTGVFLCTENMYEFSRDTDVNNFASAIAAEKWVKGFNAELNTNHQTHIEQAGRVKGVLSADGAEYNIDSPGLRDHSYGRRDWDYMNRHVWLAAVCPGGRAVNTSWVSYPALKELKSGYEVYNGAVKNVTGAAPMDKLSNGGIPKRFEYFAELSDKTVLTNKCRVDIAFPFSFQDGAYIMYEGLADFEINGEKGRGTAEFGYNADAGRWARK